MSDLGVGGDLGVLALPGNHEGVAVSYARISEQLIQVAATATRVVASGRVAREVPGFLELLADVLDIPVEPVLVKGSTLRGTAVLALQSLAPRRETGAAGQRADASPSAARRGLPRAAEKPLREPVRLNRRVGPSDRRHWGPDPGTRPGARDSVAAPIGRDTVQYKRAGGAMSQAALFTDCGGTDPAGRLR